MAKRKKESALETVEQKMENLILWLLTLGPAIRMLEQQAEANKAVLREFISKNAIGETPKGYLYWEGEKAGAELQVNPIRTLNVSSFIGAVGLDKAAPFLTVNLTAVEAAVKANALLIDTKKLKEMIKITQGTPRLIPYFGKKVLK